MPAGIHSDIEVDVAAGAGPALAADFGLGHFLANRRPPLRSAAYDFFRCTLANSFFRGRLNPGRALMVLGVCARLDSAMQRIVCVQSAGQLAARSKGSHHPPCAGVCKTRQRKAIHSLDQRYILYLCSRPQLFLGGEGGRLMRILRKHPKHPHSEL